MNALRKFLCRIKYKHLFTAPSESHFVPNVVVLIGDGTDRKIPSAGTYVVKFYGYTDNPCMDHVVAVWSVGGCVSNVYLKHVWYGTEAIAYLEALDACIGFSEWASCYGLAEKNAVETALYAKEINKRSYRSSN